MYKLSIIIPIYNVEEYLSECLDSVLMQDSPEIEVIMINDCSTDKSREIAESYKDKFNNAILINHSSNQGLGPARNTAIDATRGDYLMMLDSDDWLFDKAISILLKHIKQDDFDLLQFGCNKMHSDYSENQLYMDFPNNSSTLKQKQIALLNLPNYAWLKVVKSTFIHEQNFRFHNIYYEDIPWNIGLIFAASNIQFCKESIINYRQRDGSIIHTQSPRHLDLLKAYEYMYSELDKQTLDRELLKTLHKSFINAAYYLHLQRKVRLGNDYIGDYATLFKRIVYTHKIYPSSFRTFAMMSLVFLKLALH